MRKITIYTTIIIAQCVQSFCEITFEEEKLDMIQYIEKIMINTEFRKVVLLKSNDTDSILLQELSIVTHSHYFPTITVKLENIKQFNGKYHEKFSYDAIFEESKIYIIFVGAINYFPTVLKETSKLYFWRNRERVIVYFRDDTKDETQKMFKLCWERNITNVVFIFSDGAYTYNPFYEKYDILLNKTNVFRDKYRDMNGWKMNFSAFQTALDMITVKKKAIGRDVFLAEALTKALNATYQFVPPRDGITYGLKFPNGTMTGKLLIIALIF